MSRASGRTSANVGRSPKPAKWASSGTRARRIASRPLRPTVTTARSPGCSVISRAAKRIVFVLSGPARPRSMVIRTSRRLPPSRRDEERMLVAAEDRREVGQDLVDLLAVRPRGERRVLGALQLGRGHELHRPGDLLDVLGPTSPDPRWPDVALARHAGSPLVGLGQEASARNGGRGASSRPVASSSVRVFVSASGREDRRALGLEEAVELGLELLDPRRRDVVEGALRGRVQDRDLLLDRAAAGTAAA